MTNEVRFELHPAKLEQMGFMECPDGTEDPRGTTYEYVKYDFCIMVDCYRDVTLHMEHGGDGIPLKIDSVSDLEQVLAFVSNAGGIHELYRQHANFVAEAFPTITDYRGPLRHMAKEVQEAIESGEPEEFADILLLLFSAFRLRFPGHSAYNLVNIAFDKLAVAQRRKWGKVNEQGFSEHIK